MSARRESAAFAVVLGGLLAGLFGDSLFGGKVLSPADVLFVSASFRDVKGPGYEPANRLLIDPVLQFQPWIEFNRAMLRQGRLPLWNDRAGCGVPHLANGQSAPFDPFHLIAYLGELPDAYAWMAASRLWFAGFGMFLLARVWGLGVWGRWFAGLTFPLTGFVVVWLQYPVTNVAVWMPWVFLAADRVLSRPTPRRVGGLGLTVGGLFLGGHVQTSAHVLLAAGLDLVWRVVRGRRGQEGGVTSAGPVVAWGAGVALGLSLAAVSIVPLWVYLGKSPVWGDRERERPSPWRVTRPRALDSLCTAVPDVFGSQRRGQPNLAKAFGVHNYNESSGGYAGLATLLWLAPQAWLVRKGNSRVPFLAGLAAVGFLAAFEVPPVANLLRAAPVLNVTDLRRLTLWVAFALPLLGGVGLDQIAVAWPRATGRLWLTIGAAAAFTLGSVAFTVPYAEPWLRARAERHYEHASTTDPDVDPSSVPARADRQVRMTLTHVPRVLALTAAELAALAILAVAARRGKVSWSAARGGLLTLTVVELFRVAYGLNPAIDRADDRPVPDVIARLRSEVGSAGRVLGLGQELLPNVAMRYGLADVRNYDSVELGRNLDWFAPLYEPDGRGRSSRRSVGWPGVVRARDRLAGASVAAVVASTRPPDELGARIERAGAAWIARLDHEPLVTVGPSGGGVEATVDNGRISASFACEGESPLIVRQTYDPGWKAAVDGRPAEVEPYRGAFLSVRVGAGPHRVSLVYDPPEVRAACAASLGAVGATLALLIGPMAFHRRRFPGQGLGHP